MTDERDESGRFLPGNNVGKRTRQTSLQAALRAVLTPERVIELWQDAWDVAYSRKSPRSMVQVLEVGLNYAYGKPTQTVELNNDATAWLAELLKDRTPALPPRDTGAQLIDVEPAQLVDNGDTDVE